MNEFEGIPCAVCVVKAVRGGVSYTDASEVVIGQETASGTMIHEAITVIGGTLACWYHADDAAKAAGL